MRRSAAVAVGLLALAPAVASAAGPPRLTRAVQASLDDLAPSRTYTAPYLVVDPEDPMVVVGAAAELRTKTCHLFRSNDAGRSWKILEAAPSPASYPFCSTSSGMLTQTPLAWGRDHSLYYAMSGWDTQDGGPAADVSVILARSADLGQSWTSTVVRDARGKTGAQTENDTPVASLVVDTKSGKDDVVYVGWRAGFPQAPAFPGGQRALRPPMMAVSSDSGRTFGAPIDISSFYKKTFKAPDGSDLPIGMGFTAPSLALDGRGTLFVAYPAAAPAAFPATTAPPPLPILLGRSTDRGASFSFTEALPSTKYNEGVQILRWSPEGGADGSLHLIYEDKPDQPPQAADRDIYYLRSTDGGRTFTKPVRLNDDDPAQLRTQVTPNLSVAPNGRLDAVWWDFRNDPGTFVNDVYGSSSFDNGATWSANVRITDQSINRKVGVWSNGYDIRQPPGLVSTNQLAVVAWDDTRLAGSSGDLQDVFARTVQFEALGGGTSAIGVGVAVFAGLAVVGVLLLVLSRRRRTAPPAGPTITTRTPVEVA
jgi:hypothetical protein